MVGRPARPSATRRRKRRSQRPDRHLRTHRGDPRGRGRAIAPLLVDAGPLYAYVDGDDAHHHASLELLETHTGPLIVPILVVTEVTYLVGTRLGPEPEVRFLGDLAAGAFSIEDVPAGDWLRIAELVATYRDLPLGTVDASIVAAAERLDISDVATVAIAISASYARDTSRRSRSCHEFDASVPARTRRSRHRAPSSRNSMKTSARA